MSEHEMDETTGMWYPRKGGKEELRVFIKRGHDNGVQTLGNLEVFLGDKRLMSCYTLELPWKDNQRRVSCIPLGTYPVKRYSSQKYPETYEITEVPNRDKILIHSGTFHTDILGCVLVGESLADINNDGQLDVTSSKKTLKALKEVLGYSEFMLSIS